MGATLLEAGSVPAVVGLGSRDSIPAEDTVAGTAVGTAAGTEAVPLLDGCEDGATRHGRYLVSNSDGTQCCLG
jgi:hypothetical protein